MKKRLSIIILLLLILFVVVPILQHQVTQKLIVVHRTIGDKPTVWHKIVDKITDIHRYDIDPSVKPLLIANARKYLTSEEQIIYLDGKDFSYSDKTIPMKTTDEKIKNYNIDWRWFYEHEPDLVGDMSLIPPPDFQVPTGYWAKRYAVYWTYEKYKIIVTIDSNLTPNKTEISTI